MASNKVFGAVGLIISLVLFSLLSYFSFNMLMFAGLSGGAGNTGWGGRFATLALLLSVFLIINMSRMVQGRSALPKIYGILIVLAIIGILITPFHDFQIHLIPRSILYNISTI